MVTLSFRNRDTSVEVLLLAVNAGGEPRSLYGDASWLDFSFKPVSASLGRPVGLHEDAEEWARALPGAYVGTNLDVRILDDRPDAPPLPPGYEPNSSDQSDNLTTPTQKSPLKFQWQNLGSFRLLFSCAVTAGIAAWLSSLLWAPLAAPVFFVVLVPLWLAMMFSPGVVLYCPFCKKRVKMGAKSCHHCGHTVVVPAVPRTKV